MVETEVKFPFLTNMCKKDLIFGYFLATTSECNNLPVSSKECEALSSFIDQQKYLRMSTGSASELKSCKITVLGSVFLSFDQW